jgi:Uma2 family endonuclease
MLRPMNAPVRNPIILTDAQFEDMARKGAFAQVGRVELRGGVIVAMSPVYLSHSSIMSGLAFACRTALLGSAGNLQVHVELSIRCGGGFQPTADIVVFDPADVTPGYDGPLPKEAVRLVIEVAQASLPDDLGAKKDDYAQAGIAEYWVADVAGRVLHRFADPAEGVFQTSAPPVAFGVRAAALSFPLVIETASL